MEYKDYYQIMGLKREASQDEIKRAYRKLARKYHPDVSTEPDAEARIKEVNEAYEVLKDPEKRAAYDQLGGRWQAGQNFNPPPDWDQGFEFRGGGYTNAGPEQFSDFFSSLFGQDYVKNARSAGFGRNHNAQGFDTHSKILIDLETAYQGGMRMLSLKHSELGPDGRPRIKQRSLKVQIPKGVTPGQQIRLAGQGGVGLGKGRSGDLYLEVGFEPHPYFKTEGKNVFLDLPVTPWELALGATVKAPTPAGNVELKIPPNAAPGQKMRLKGRGIPANPPGDFFVVLEVALPPSQSEKAKKAYADFKQSCDFNPRTALGV